MNRLFIKPYDLELLEKLHDRVGGLEMHAKAAIRARGDGDYEIVGLYFPKWHASNSEARCEGDDVADAYLEYRANGGAASEWIGEVHSHGIESWSQTDHQDAMEHAQLQEYSVSLVRTPTKWLARIDIAKHAQMTGVLKLAVDAPELVPDEVVDRIIRQKMLVDILRPVPPTYRNGYGTRGPKTETISVAYASDADVERWNGGPPPVVEDLHGDALRIEGHWYWEEVLSRLDNYRLSSAAADAIKYPPEQEEVYE